MEIQSTLGSGSSYASRGVCNSRPRRVAQKVQALGLIVVLALGGLADATHSVVQGDNLWRLATRYGSSVSAIASANGIRNLDLIRIGQLLRIPGSTPLNPATPTAGGANLLQYRVAAGDNLTSIAAKFGSTVLQLVSVNQIRHAGFIYAGQLLSVPAPPLRVAGGPIKPVAPPQTAPPALVRSVAVPVPPQPVSLPPGPPVTTVASVKPAGVEDLIELYSQQFGVQPALMKAIAWQESGWQQGVVSSAGAIGVMQVMPETGAFIARELLKAPVNLNVKEENIRAGIRFFAFYLSKTNGDERTAVAGYFQGLRSVWETGIHENTKVYVNSVMALRGRFLPGGVRPGTANTAPQPTPTRPH